MRIPEGMIRGIMDGTNPPVHILLPKNSLEAIVFKELTMAGARTLGAAQAGIYAGDSLLAAVLEMATKKENGGNREMEQEQKSSLILILVNQGFTGPVMETAKKAGARGGTIIRGRWVGEEQTAQLRGLASQSEKEMLFIVAPKEIRNQVMDAVNSTHGVQTEAGALVCSLGIDRLVHLG